MATGVMSRFSGTTCGLLAIACWGSSVAGTRALSEAVGPAAAACCVFLITGLAVILYYALRRQELRRLMASPWRYLVACGGLFVLYEAVYYGAIGLSHNAQQAIEVSVLNYLWPALTLVFSIPILNVKARPTIALGLLLAIIGVALVEVDVTAFSARTLGHNIADNPLPYALGLIAGVSWALYSALSRRWAAHISVNPVPLYLLMCAVVFVAFGWPAAAATVTQARWTLRTLAELAYMTIVVTFLGYWLWNQGMQTGRVVLIVSASYLTPLIAVLITWLYFGATLRSTVWLGCALLVAGSIVCKLSADEPQEQPSSAA